MIWGRRWDDLLARDVDGVLVNKMNTTLDGDYQTFATQSGAYIREHFFGPDPRLRKMVEHLSDIDLQQLPRGGHDYRKLYAAYKMATDQSGPPTVILAKTIKGWTLGPEIEGRNATHQIKKMTREQLRLLRDRLYLQDEIPDSALDAEHPPYYVPAPVAGSDYLEARLNALGGSLPQRVVRGRGPLRAARPGAGRLRGVPAGLRGQAVSTTMAFARMLRNLLRDPGIGRYVVPIIPDEGRTFGLDALFAEAKIYAYEGQRYTSVDAGLLLSYAEDRTGQILQEGISEAGGMGSFQAAGTAYATWSTPMLPIYLFYSMFGFQRVGDLIWQAADAAPAVSCRVHGRAHHDERRGPPARGRPLPSSRHHRAERARLRPGVRLRARLHRRRRHQAHVRAEAEDVLYYVTLYNENYPMPALPDDEAERRGSGRGCSGVLPVRPAAGAATVGRGGGRRRRGRRRRRNRDGAGQAFGPQARRAPGTSEEANTPAEVPTAAGDDPVLRHHLAGGHGSP